MDSSCPLQELFYIVNHVVLPPKLPQQEEAPDLTANAERILLDLVLSNAQRFGERCTPERKAPWTAVQSMLARWIATRPHNQFSEPLLEAVISEMKPGDALPIRIHAQNAALVLRHIDEAISVECFELSSSSAAVLGSSGSLRRKFPAHGLAVPIGVAADPSFRHELCHMLSRLALETVDEMMPQARKAGSERAEVRDTCHPGLVTEMLMASLSAVGKPHKVQQVQKRIRDDVLWKDCILPWRRSSLWLLCKISIQTTLLQRTDPQSARAQYKNFIIYFLADILSRAWRASLGINECKVIQMKTARRAAKLDGIILSFVQEAAIAAAKAVARSQDEHWQQLQQQDADRATTVSLASVEEDTALTLHNCRSALDQALRETEGEPQPDIPFPASSHNWITIASDGFPMLHSDLMNTEEKTYALAEFEEWVSESLPTWLENALDQPCATQCISIANCAGVYKTLASNMYDGCPEQLSLMLLVAGELWRALDTLTGSLTPLLHQYPPEIPKSIFAPLLLPKTAQMQRLHSLELYIQGRYNSAEFTSCSLFADPSTSTDKCFACRYYSQSAGHRELHRRIVDKAEKDRDEKRQEWRRDTDRYNELKRQYDAISQCDTITNEYGIGKHKSTCRKCDLKSAMDRMVIYVFEWPLPRNDILCKLVIFELRCPIFFAAWRNLTWMIINDLGRPRATVGSSPYDFLNRYVQLKSHYEHSSSRVVLGASVKSMEASHYRRMTFPVKLDNICTEHALRWQYYDETRGFWVCDQVDPPSFAGRCETRLPEGSYNTLEFAVNSTDHSQNAVLASQTECSSELNLHEYITYGSLRADGNRTPWLNICRELQASNLSWNTEAVCALIKQSAWQAGPSGDTHLRIAHVVDSIQANCQSVYTMNILIVLILRTMSLAGDEWVSEAIALLRKCRTGVVHWMLGLADALRLTTNAKRIQRIRRNLLRVALLCKMTFDVDSEYVSEVMISPEELSYWAFSSMIVNENTPGAESGLPADLRRFLLCDRKLSHARHKRLLTLFTTTTNRGLDQAVLKTWSSFQSPNDLWNYHGDTGDRWLCKVTRSELNGLSQTVYYNILNGQLLVDGRPLGILPKEYTTHDLFIRLFGAQILRVSVSNMAGMLYMTANEEYGYTFYFLLKGSDLVVKAKNSSAVFEIVPHQRFNDDFPVIFVEDHVHWLDLYSNEVEFRPLDQRWKPNAENWRLHYASQGISRLEKGQTQLVDVRSSTFKSTLAVFEGIERAEYLHVVKTPDKTIEVELPRLGLRFLANNTGELECQELRKVVDSDQALGSMIGLRSRLILCAKGEKSSSLDRIVLIPKGDVCVTRYNSHVRLSIATTGRDVRCLRYQHNFILDRLDGDGSMLSRLYQAYLHALTSFVLPDPLTENLGTEEALRILREQSMRCCKPLEAEEMDLLQPIAALTPRRDFYPKHLRVMQQISWRNDLSPLSQHGEFEELVDSILTRARMFSIFYSGLGPSPAVKPRGDASLLWRARVRNAAYWNFENGGNLCSSDNDKEYQARDGIHDGIRASRVSAISSLVGSWSKDLGVPAYKLADRLRAWGTVTGFGTNFNLSTSISDLLNLSFSSSWAPLYKYCRCASREKSMYKIFFLFATIAYSCGTTGIKDLKVLLAFATEPSLRDLPPFPNYQCFTLERGSTLDRDQVRSSIATHVKDWPMSRRRKSTSEEVLEKQRTEHERVTNLHVNTTTDIYANQWPCEKPAPIPEKYSQWIIIKEASSAVQKLFSNWHKNKLCEKHLARIQDVLGTLTASAIDSTYEPSTWHQCACVPGDSHTHPLKSLGSLMGARSPVKPQLPSLLSDDPREELPETNQDLRSLIVNFDTRPNDRLRAQYRDDLLGSLADFDTHLETNLPGEIPHPLKKRASLHLETYQNQLMLEIELVRDELEPQEPIPQLLKMSGLWPRLRVCDLLSATSTTSRIEVPPEWKESIITVGMGLTILQRARRLVLAVERGDSLSFFRELENSGRQGWSAYERPDWLLIEIENDLLVRPVQARVALEMIDPSSSANTLMQLNMGEGKSSVIIPLIAAALANGDQILRVIVLRSLARQMQDTIRQRLGGLAGRPIYHLPFSRRTSMDESTIQHMQALYEECRKTKGILIAQPEHILSFKLMGLERLASTSVSSENGEVDSGSYKVATKLLETQTWLEEHCRDVLDESDEILDVKFQLIYTLGAQRSMDGQPDRCIMMESVFDLVARQANNLQRLYPGKVEIRKQTSSSFPTIRLLSTEVRKALISRIVEDIGDSRVYGVVMSKLAPDVKKAAVAFIADDNVAEADCKLLQVHCLEDELYLKKLLFLRGLVAGGIVLHVLHEKRWSVNYGLHPTRCLCAVPYRAKGVPAATAEFGHPDVTIALTCLSYCYSGLSDLQIRSCLEILQKADDPTAEYDNWAHVKTFPEPLRHWNAVNLEDQQQCENVLYPALRYSKKVADFFLTHVVFPKEGKEFDQKLSTSGWDIPARPTSEKVTTGFSGTNDNRFLLPLTIEQRDPPELLHTSGKVLEFVTRPENLAYACARDEKGAHLSSEQLLQFIQSSDSSIRVLIDVGAQILDLSNDQVIGQWLPLMPDVDAGIYFDENDYAMVLTRTGKREKLATSSFSNRMDRCIVYLDDVHTRGTDLKLPLTARAAVTLGPRLTKDRLVQACMRLRQLGHGQSLMFFAPLEVHQEIANAASTADLNGLDVIKWALEQSCLHIERNQPLRVTQGLHYFQRLEIIDEINDCLRTRSQTDDSSLPTDVISKVVEHEAQSLHDLYAPEPMRKKNESDLITSSRSKPDTAIQDLLEIWDRIDLKDSIGAKINEEHEREVAHEVEKETQIERPPPSTPRTREVDSRIREFIRSGLSSSVAIFQSVNSTALKPSSASPHRKGREKIWDCLRVSTDFRRTVKLDETKNDNFLRPVHWLLVSLDPDVQSILLISQYEANQLLDEILDLSSRVALVCYEPRVTKTMPSLDAATAHPLPRAKEAWGNLSRGTRLALHLFAGQLYFTTFEDYEGFCRTLAKPDAAPLTLVREWMGIRRKGQNYLQTHVGQVVSGRVLHREMFGVGDVDDAMAVDTGDTSDTSDSSSEDESMTG